MFDMINKVAAALGKRLGRLGFTWLTIWRWQGLFEISSLLFLVPNGQIKLILYNSLYNIVIYNIIYKFMILYNPLFAGP